MVKRYKFLIYLAKNGKKICAYREKVVFLRAECKYGRTRTGERKRLATRQGKERERAVGGCRRRRVNPSAIDFPKVA